MPPRPPAARSTLAKIRRQQSRRLGAPLTRTPAVEWHPNPYERTVDHTQVSASGSPHTNVPIVIQTSPPAKRVRTATPECPLPPGPPPCREPRKQGASALMQIFAPHFRTMLECILRRETPMNPRRTCHCGGSAAYRCNECHNDPGTVLLCASCILMRHRGLPYHWLEKWNGRHFIRQALVDLGHTIELGHDGESCPHRSRTRPHKRLIILHTNGIHRIDLQYCHCAACEPHISQLLLAQLFPATVDHPATAFTFALLEDFHLHSLTSKKAAYDYWHALCRHTDNAFPQDNRDRYREFLRAVRIWRHLTAIKRSGQFHGIDAVLPHRMPGSVAVRCPACPEPGLNMSPQWEHTRPSQRHLHTLFLAADGNFSLQKKKKSDDPDDVALGNGNAYFPPPAAYDSYLKSTGETAEKSTCAHLKVVNMQNKSKFRDRDVTGVVAVACARHAIIRPRSIVDLQKGERYANVDYALAQALSECADLPWLVLSYDVSCQYVVKLADRFKKHFPDQLEPARRLLALIPKMHLHGHKDDCAHKYSFNFTECVGRTHGETIETPWSENNQAGGSTKEMNAGHRHDTLDDIHGDWNWTKVQTMSRSLSRAYTKAVTMARQAQDKFDALSVSQDLITKWQDICTAQVTKGPEWQSPYHFQLPQAITQSKAYQKLVAAEYNQRPHDAAISLEASFLNDGLGIQASQARVMNLVKQAGDAPSSAASTEIAKARSKLHNEIISWRKYQCAHYPQLNPRIATLGFGPAESETLLLPSDFTPAERQEFGLVFLGEKEHALRVGQANDALDSLRLSLKQTAMSTDFKKQSIRGQKDNTRAQGVLKALRSKTLKHAAKYRDARAALVSLGMEPDNSTYKPLENSELWMKRLDKSELGDSSKREPWFWNMGPCGVRSGSARSAWEEEVDRVRWFREQANRDRWREEVEILEEEFRRTYRYFSRMEEVWMQLAQGCDQSATGAGKQAYAYKQVTMYRKMAGECQKLYEDATGLHLEPGGSKPSHGEEPTQ